MSKIIICCLFVLFIIKSINTLKCLDENEHEVDWWVAYKLPQLAKGSTSGDSLVFVTSRTIKIEQNWIFSPKPISSNNSIIAATLNQIYLNSQMFNYVQYNDEIPVSARKVPVSSHSAHAKGIVAFDNNDGFWIVHSIPKFPPPLNHHYEYPSTGLHYGQTALCISFESTEIQTNQILNQLLIMRPTVYAHNFADNSFQNDWSRLIDHEWSTIESQMIKLNSIDGVEFQSFSKSPLHEIEIYEDDVAVELKQSLKVEAISTSKEGPYVCIGDLNRVHSQAKRGGGVVCQSNLDLWTIFSKSIQSFEPC